MGDEVTKSSEKSDPNKEFANALVEAASEPLKDIVGQFFPTKEERQSDRDHRADLLRFERDKHSSEVSRFEKEHNENIKNNSFFRWVGGIGLIIAAIGGFALIIINKECLGTGILTTALGTGLGFMAGRQPKSD
ncbi:hypothetical protein [Thiomicrorhabdus sp. Kp2]|uniref:hypothetical protein n=1 Tax=Thiomicrorhabdus sp. Kp2 TaxID=1123518 RepID=UPI0012FF3303|nr:hypothetical protein [Thiomicrorhabdus sp. Kp2]